MDSYLATFSHWLLRGEEYLLFTSTQANRHMRKALFTCVVYTNIQYLSFRLCVIEHSFVSI